MFLKIYLYFRLEKKFVEGSLDMDLALKAFRKLKEEFGKEFQEFELQVFLNISNLCHPHIISSSLVALLWTRFVLVR